MYTESTLEILDNYFNFYEKKIKCTPFTWNKKIGRLNPTPNKWQFYHSIFYWVSGLSVLAYMTGRLLQELFIPDPRFKAYQMIMYIFYYFVLFLSCATNYTLMLQTEDVAHTVNVNNYLHFTFRDQLCPFEKGKHPPIPMGEKILKLMIPGTFFISFCGACLSLMSPLDPLQRLVIDYVPQIYDDYRWYVKIWAFCSVQLFGCTIWCPMALTVALSLMYLDGGIFWFSTLNGSNMQEVSRRARAILKEDLKLQLNLFRALGLLNFMVNNYIAGIVLPVTLAVAALITIICNYATVKLYDSIPMPGFLMMPLVSVFVYLAAGMLLRLGVRFHGESSDFVDMLLNHHEKKIRVVGRALRPLAMQYGDYGSITRGITFSYFGFITDMSIDMIMT